MSNNYLNGKFCSTLVRSVIVCVALLLNSCATNITNVNQRPADWAPAEEISPGANCPNISGVYEDNAENCGGTHCQLLNDFLFRIDYPLAESVEITLLSDETLKIIGKWPGAKTEIVLSRREGDFNCGPEGLFVSSSEGSFFAGWTAHGIADETRIFNRCSDGSLVMKLESKMHGNVHLYPIAPYSSHEVDWTRWRATPASE